MDVDGGAAVHEPGYGEEDQEVEQAGQEAPEEAALADAFAGGEAAEEAGDEVDRVDHDVYLSLFQAQLVEGEGQHGQEDAAEHVGDQQGAKHGFGNSVFHLFFSFYSSYGPIYSPGLRDIRNFPLHGPRSCVIISWNYILE